MGGGVSGTLGGCGTMGDVVGAGGTGTGAVVGGAVKGGGGASWTLSL